MTLTCFVFCQNESDRANYGTLYPRGVERTRDFFSQNVVTSIHIGLNSPTLRRDEQPALHSPPLVGSMPLDRFQIQNEHLDV